MAVLWAVNVAHSQEDRINFPVEGTVLQRNSSDNAVFRFGGQVKRNKTFYFSIRKKVGDNSYNSINADQRTITLGNSTPEGGKVYFVNQSSGGDLVLGKGWYKLTLFYRSGIFNRKKICDTKEFGVGDVYFIGGQSNAAGFGGVNMTGFGGGTNWNAIGSSDNCISTSGSSDYSDLVRVYSNRQHENNETAEPQSINPLRGPGFTQPQRIAKNGLPYKTDDINGLGVIKNEFSIFKNGNLTNPDANRVPMYPNGYNSWCWAPLGYKFATVNNDKYAGVPTIWFNAAASGTSMVDARLPNPFINDYNAWGRNFYGSNSLAVKLATVIRNYGSVLGAKAVLWCQGENDTGGIAFSNKLPDGVYPGDDYILNNYQNVLNNLINFSRENATGQLSSSPDFKKLNWFVSKTSANSVTVNSNTNGTEYLTQISINSAIGHKSDEIRSRQAVNSAQNVFEGPDTDIFISNGVRSNGANVHFTGSSLSTLANEWHSKITSANSSASVEATQPLGLSNVTGGGSTYTLTVNNTIGATHFFWQKNNDAVMRVPNNCFSSPLSNETTSTSFTFNGVSPGDVLHCYAYKPVSTFTTPNCTNTNGRFHAVSPYVVPSSVLSTKILDTEQSSLTINSSGSNVSTALIIQNVDWEIDSKPSWISESYDEDNNRLIFSSSSTSTTRSGSVILKDSESSLTKTIYITQSGSTSITTSLTSLNPTNSSSEWQGYGTARFNGTSIDGNVINIGGTQYTQGIGTHANSRIVYNLNNAYSTFSCKFGMDQESNCCDGSTFTIKADGQTIYGPVTKVWGQAATVVNGLSVAGKSTLELITDQISNNYADHTDWADVYLQSGSGGCGTPPIAPSNPTASPSSINSGGSSTLSATCAYGTVTWSTGATGNSTTVSPGVTTNYTVKCVSVGCQDSPVVGVTVNVSNSPCSAVTNNLTMGTWTVTGHLLVARYFNNQYWLTQRIGTNPEKFLVRGSNMLTRGDVTLANSSYYNLTTCFGWQNSNYGGLAVPNSTQFATPSGFTLSYESDGTPYYTANGSCGLTAPTSVSSSPASISSGQSSTLSATCATGTRLWSTGATSATIVVSPTSTTTYTVKCTQSGCPDSPTSSVTVQVGPCASLSNNLVMGTWNVTGHQLVAKYYHNQWWLVQRIATNPEKFLVRGSEMLTRGDVTLTNGSYSSLVGCFGWTYSAYNGLGTPNSTQFPTPSGWQYGTEPDGTPFYTSTGGARMASDQDFIKEVTPSFVSVYPNPNQGTFSMKVYLEKASTMDIDLINSTGKIYQSIKAEGKEGQNEIPFTAQNIGGGNYLIRVKTKDKVESTVVVIR